MTDRNRILQWLRVVRICSRKQGFVGILCVCFFGLILGINTGNHPKGWVISAYAAIQTAAVSNTQSANELPEGLWKAIAAKYKVNINQVKLIAIADLDGDGKSDAVLKILGDYCGLCGCSVGIFKKDSDSYRQISDISCVEEIVVDKKRTNGWLDLLASSKKGYFRLTFDGQSYPVSPLEGKPEKKGTSKDQ
jgi:hypothetical protein